MITILIQSVFFFLSGHQSSTTQDQQYQLPVEIDPLIGTLSFSTVDESTHMRLLYKT